MTAREEVIALVSKFPDDASFELIVAEVENLATSREIEAARSEFTAKELSEIDAAIAEGIADIEAGRTKTQEEVREMVKSWAKECNSK